MGTFYILDDDKNVIPTDLIGWMNFPKAIIVRSEKIANKTITTIFTGININFPDKSPLVFETSIFDSKGKQEPFSLKSSTWEEAIKAHETFVMQELQAA